MMQVSQPPPHAVGIIRCTQGPSPHLTRAANLQADRSSCLMYKRYQPCGRGSARQHRIMQDMHSGAPASFPRPRCMHGLQPEKSARERPSPSAAWAVQRGATCFRSLGRLPSRFAPSQQCHGGVCASSPCVSGPDHPATEHGVSPAGTWPPWHPNEGQGRATSRTWTPDALNRIAARIRRLPSGRTTGSPCLQKNGV